MGNEIEARLRETEITESAPGSILRDFQTLLDFVGVDGVKASERHALLPMARLRELDERMTRPMRPTLQRPQQRSFPNINGLYLLLRATELAVIRRVGSACRLSIDPKLLAKWQQLNPTERYCGLLEAWLLIADDGMWGDGSSSPGVPFLVEVLDLIILFHILNQPGRSDREYSSVRTYEQTHLALMEMFGLVELERKPPRAGKNRHIVSARTTDFGSDIFHFFCVELGPVELIKLTQTARRFGAWRPTLGQIFPEWRNSLR